MLIHFRRRNPCVYSVGMNVGARSILQSERSSVPPERKSATVAKTAFDGFTKRRFKALELLVRKPGNLKLEFVERIGVEGERIGVGELALCEDRHLFRDRRDLLLGDE